MDLQSPTLFILFSGQGKFYSYMGYDSSKHVDEIMRFSRVVRASTVNAEVATVPGSIPASSETVESEGRKMKQWRIQFKKIPPPKKKKHRGRRLEQRP